MYCGNNMNFNSKTFNHIAMGLLIVGPLLLLCLPADFFDSSTTQLCLSKICFNRECIGCGITRAVMHFIHFEFAEALKFNKLVVLVVPFLVYLWIDAFLNCLKTIRKK